MKKLITTSLLFFIFISAGANATEKPEHWLIKFSRHNQFTYRDFIDAYDESNSDLYYKAFAASYYSGIVRATTALVSINQYQGHPIPYCIEMNQVTDLVSYVNGLKFYYDALNDEQQKIADSLPLEIMHIKALTFMFPCINTVDLP